MSAADPSSSLRAADQAGWFQRLVWFVAAVVLAGLLVTAWRLHPASEGMGTHQQLGLPPCTAVVLWGVRCPACGMTTSWAYYTEGRWMSSFVTNAGGFAFAVIATFAVPLLGYLAITGQQARAWMLPTLAIVMIVALTITLVDWTIRLYA